MAVVWLIVKILLWALAALLGLALLALLVPVTVEISYTQKAGAALWLRVLPVHIRLYPRPAPRRKKPGKAKKRGGPGGRGRHGRAQAAGAAGPHSTPPAPAAAGGQGAAQQTAPAAEKGQAQPPKAGAAAGGQPLERQLPFRLGQLGDILATAGGFMRRVLAGLRVHGLKAYLPVCRETAAQTALGVGRVWAALGAALGVLQNFVRVQPGEVTVEPDYTGQRQGDASFSCKITAHLIIMVIAGLWALRRLKQQKII